MNFQIKLEHQIKN